MYGDWRKNCWYLVGIDEDGDWVYYMKDKFNITEYKEYATCFKTSLEAKSAKAWLEKELEKRGYPDDENVNSVEKWIVAYYDEKSGCLFDAVTDKFLYNYDGANPEELGESISMLESAGYRVLKNKKYILEDNDVEDNGVKVGDIFVATSHYGSVMSWFFKITSVKGKRVTYKELKKVWVDGDGFQGHVMPTDEFDDNPIFRNKFSILKQNSDGEYYFKLDNYTFARPWNGKEVWEDTLD